MRVLVVDDSAFMRRAITTMLSADPAIEVVGTARNGKDGVEQAKQLKPDVVTLDIEMPVMDGLTALRRIMRECPTQVLMCSSLTTEGSHAALSAMRHGAADVIAKDTSQVSLNVMSLQDDLQARVKALGGAGRRRAMLSRTHADAPAEKLPAYRDAQFDVVCIGSSTGGPPVLEKILTAIPASFKTPIVVAQHMPEVFTRSMAERLGRTCNLPVIHAEDGMPVAPGTIFIAPGGQNTHLKKIRLARWQLLVNSEPKEALYKPNVTALLHSAAQATLSRTLAIILTGMGEDGLEGARELHECGGTIIAQDEETCVVYGMPKAVTQNGLVAASLSPDSIAKVLASMAAAPGVAASAPTVVPRRTPPESPKTSLKPG